MKELDNYTRSKKVLLTTTLIALLGAGFSYYSPLLASTKAARAEKGKKSAKKKSDSADKTVDVGIDDKELFLRESEVNVQFLPDIFKCPECGYEQDEEGFCPDHNEAELVKVLAKGRDPLEPSEFDGNEDIVVDIPLKNLEFRKEAILQNASASKSLTNNDQEVGR